MNLDSMTSMEEIKPSADEQLKEVYGQISKLQKEHTMLLMTVKKYKGKPVIDDYGQDYYYADRCLTELGIKD